ncbi:hypothetical protein BDM02DRAFT_3193099 [Thelephora ganbajun]|uniref:Uncharacterized protein n=1 Tax=Thelephora ganbajun TaxID=370292 RepID=A0ACB6Z057_THEGA|nr:hypothetical protein BDM02DRAFT_3193099 [Thelephora ganbajun]
MTLENNHTFISPHGQKITCINMRSHSKDGQMTNDSFGFMYPTMPLLVDTIILQVDNEFPQHQFATGCSFNNIVWQQAIGALKHIDHEYHGKDHRDDEHVLFNLVQARLVDHQAFDLPHKWSSHSIHYSAMVADHLWAMFTTECARNDRLEADLNALKGEVNNELKKDGEHLNRHRACLNMITDKHNASIEYISNMSSQLELHQKPPPLRHPSATDPPPIGTPKEQSTPTPPPEPRALQIPHPNASPTASTPPLQHHPPQLPPPRRCTQMTTASSITPASISSSIQLCTPTLLTQAALAGGPDTQGQVGVNANTLIGLESSKTSAARCAEPIVALTQEQLETLSPEARGYHLLSVMWAVTMMPNATVYSHLQSSDFVSGELQLVFPIGQEDFDALMSGELSAEVQPITILEVVQSRVPDDAEDTGGEDDGWVTNHSVAGLE